MHRRKDLNLKWRVGASTASVSTISKLSTILTGFLSNRQWNVNATFVGKKRKKCLHGRGGMGCVQMVSEQRAVWRRISDGKEHILIVKKVSELQRSGKHEAWQKRRSRPGFSASGTQCLFAQWKSSTDGRMWMQEGCLSAVQQRIEAYRHVISG